MINNTELKFVDISTEKTRTYVTLGKGTITINNPLKLAVTASGGHRLFDKQGISHYIPPTWNHLYWTTKKGKANFVK